ncbi:MAG: aldo/keto reductase, partial [Planctomycetota bacterium]
IVLGTMTFGREADDTASANILDAALEAGVNCIDTANTYAHTESERVLARLLAGRRDQVILTSKVCGPVGEGPNGRGLSRRHIIASCEDSLRRLGTDHLDIYFMHYTDDRCDPEIPLRAMDELVQSGKVRYIGASTAEIEILPMAQATGLGVMTYSPLGAGVLTGKYTRRHGGAEGRLATDKQYQARYHRQSDYEVGNNLAALAQEAGYEPATLAAAWALHNESVHAVITSARRVEQLHPVLAAGTTELPTDLAQRVSELVPPVPLATDRDEER